MKRQSSRVILLFLLLASCLPVHAQEIRTVVQRPFDDPPPNATPAEWYEPTFFQISEDQRLAVAGWPRELHVYDLRTRRLLDRIKDPVGTIIGGVAIDPTGRFLVLCRGTAPVYGPELSIRSIRDGRETELVGFVPDEIESEIVSRPTIIGTDELVNQDPWSCAILPESVTFIREADGKKVVLPFSTTYQPPTPEPSIANGIPGANGTTLHWNGDSNLGITSKSGAAFSVPLIPDPDLKMLSNAEVHFSAGGGKFVCAVDTDSLYITDLFKDELVFKTIFSNGLENGFPFPAASTGPAYDVDGNVETVAIYNGRGNLSVYDIKSGNLIAQKSGAPPFDLSGDGKTLAYWDNSRSGIACLRLDTGKEFLIARSPDPVNTPSLALSPDGSRLAVAAFMVGDDPGIVYDTTSGDELLRIAEMHSPLTFNRDGGKLACSHYRGRWESMIALVDLDERSIIKTAESVFIDGYHPSDISFDATGDHLLVPNGEAGVVRLKIGASEISQEEILLAGKFHGRINCSPDGAFASALSQEGEVVIFDPNEFSKSGVASVYYVNSGHVVLVKANSEYIARPESLDAVAFRIGESAYPLDQFDLALNRPDTVLKSLGAPAAELALISDARSRRLRRMGLDESKIRFDGNFPTMQILDRDSLPLTTEATEIEISYQAEAGEEALSRLVASVNDVPLLGKFGLQFDAGERLEAGGTLRVKLGTGTNKIEISTISESGIESIRETVYINRVSSNETTPKTYILSIGVSDYVDDTLDLGLAAKDANDFVAAFKASRSSTDGVVESKLVTDTNATRENILDAKPFFEQSGVDDLVVVFIAGHGFQDANYDYWFGTTDIDYEQPAGRGLSFDDLESFFDGIPARNRLLLMDTCFAGEVDKEDVVLADAGGETTRGVTVRAPTVSRLRAKSEENDLKASTIETRFFADLRRRMGASVFTASSGVEFVFAEETDEVGNGVFTHSFMKAMAEPALADDDSDGEVPVSEMLDFVIREVSELTDGRQRPTGRQLNRELDIVLSSSGEKATVPKPEVTFPSGSTKWEVIEKVEESLGGWKIEWIYEFVGSGNGAFAKGGKVRVNDKTASRGEKIAISEFDLSLAGRVAQGPSKEVNHLGNAIPGSVKIEFNESFDSFTGTLLDSNGVLSSILTGRRVDE